MIHNRNLSTDLSVAGEADAAGYAIADGSNYTTNSGYITVLGPSSNGDMLSEDNRLPVCVPQLSDKKESSTRGFRHLKVFACLTGIALIGAVLVGTSVGFMFSFNRVSTLNEAVYGLQQENVHINKSLKYQYSKLKEQIEVLAAIPPASCAAILESNHTSPSGYYSVKSFSGANALVYCDMSMSCGGVTGGWIRVAELDMRKNSSQCPSNLREHIDSDTHTCGVESDGACSSITFSTAIAFSKVCGRIHAYPFGTPDAFDVVNINDNYVDGISLTYGDPRHHIWTFAAALSEDGTISPSSNCQCTDIEHGDRSTPPPAFVGNDYFCDTGEEDDSFVTHRPLTEDPLWDGAGCGPRNTCCSFNNPPWFYKQLPRPSTDDIEMRVCIDEGLANEDIAIEAYEIFVQ